MMPPMGKRANGEGLLRQRPNGSWECRITYEDLDIGQRQRLSVYAPTAKAARAKAKKAQERIHAGAPVRVCDQGPDARRHMPRLWSSNAAAQRPERSGCVRLRTQTPHLDGQISSAGLNSRVQISRKAARFGAFPICDTVAGLRLRSSRCCAQVSQARQL
jgi:hypothetical protein